MKSTLLIILYTLPCFTFAQLGMDTLDHNNTSALVSNQGTFFNDDVNNLPGYEVPKGSGLNSIYGLQFWFGGKDGSGTIRTALGGNPTTGTDFFNGPFSTTGQYGDPSYNEPYIISLCQEEIDNYILWWQCLSDPSTVGCESVYSPSNSTLERINSWPGSGNTSIGQSYSLAPFFDNDLNGTYNPGGGDYPNIKGCCATYVIQNDNAGAHTFSGTEPVGLEIHYMFYQYASSDFLNDATFIDMRAINHGTATYSEFAYGLMMDADIGFPIDDYFGSDSTTNTMFFYNADNLDETEYLANPPAIGITALESEVFASSIFSFYGSPVENWNVMNGKRSNGSDILTPSGTATTYEYSGNPTNPSDWSEMSTGTPLGGRKGSMTQFSGPLSPGDVISQTYAVLFARPGDHLQNANEILTQAAQLKLLYDNNALACEDNTLGLSEESIEGFRIYPNPTADVFFIENDQNNTLVIEVVDLRGTIIIPSFESAQSIIQMEMKAISSGVYLVNISNGNERITSQLIVNN